MDANCREFEAELEAQNMVEGSYQERVIVPVRSDSYRVATVI